jgi:hypothetical protein
MRLRRALCTFGGGRDRRFCIETPLESTGHWLVSKEGHMRVGGFVGRRAATWLCVCCLLMSPSGTPQSWILVAAQSSAPPARDGGWPRRYVAPDGAVILLYEPQIADWNEQRRLTMHAAVSHTPKGTDRALIGTIVVEADTRVSVEERLVDFSDFRILQSNFPVDSREQGRDVVSGIKASIPLTERVIALDRVLASYDASLIRPKNVDGVKADPPLVFFSTRPAIIVNLDGQAVWSPIPNNDLRFALNTNWDLFDHRPSQTYYLRHDRVWLKAPDLAGPWTAAGTVPASFVKLPADDNWKDVRAALPARAVAPANVPTVHVSTVPAELILLRGQPQYEPVAGTQLLWVKNTDSDLFRVGATGPVYYLVAGRWFSAPGFTGPWTFATPALPSDFARIPLEHERSRVLASVPGTVQAAEAVLLAQVPQTARVSKKDVNAPEVVYQGAPEFQPIATTTVSRAVNTDKDIIKVGDLYYMCFQGVWFVSRTPGGPWEVTGSVPQVIYDIPVSSPAHHVTYVTVEDDDDEWVVFAAAAAYTGVMVAWGCAVWGTGFYYPPYVWYGGFAPVYYPHFPTYGYSAWYNPWTGSYGRGVAAYGPYGGAGVGARYNPRTGTYARGAAAYGPYGARGYAQGYNPRTGAYGATRQGSNVYGSWGATGVRRGDDWAATARVTSNVTGATTRVTRTDDGAAVTRRGPQGGGVVTSGGDVYAGRDGNVYRRQGDSWQKHDNGSWAGAQPDAATVGQLNRDSASRGAGTERSNDAARARSGSSAGRTGSYRPSGASRGGGRRR